MIMMNRSRSTWLPSSSWACPIRKTCRSRPDIRWRSGMGRTGWLPWRWVARSSPPSMRAVTQAASTPRISAVSPALRPGSLAPMSILLQVRTAPHPDDPYSRPESQGRGLAHLVPQGQPRRTPRAGPRRDGVESRLSRKGLSGTRGHPRPQKGRYSHSGATCFRRTQYVVNAMLVRVFATIPIAYEAIVDG